MALLFLHNLFLSSIPYVLQVFHYLGSDSCILDRKLHLFDFLKLVKIIIYSYSLSSNNVFAHLAQSKED